MKNEDTEKLRRFTSLLEIRALVLQEHLDGNETCRVKLTLPGTEAKISAAQEDKCFNAFFSRDAIICFFALLLVKVGGVSGATQRQLGVLYPSTREKISLL